jgi:beta-glucosidase-like glycosyl hydrolase
LNAIELKPFKAAIDAGVMGIMTAHTVVPALDDSGVPATVSRKIITDLLRNKLGFKGLITTDGMGMEGMTNLFESSDAAVRALAAGADLILGANVCRGKYNHNWADPIGKTIDAIEKALEDGTLNKSEFNQKVMRVLRVKEWALNQTKKNTHTEAELLAEAQNIKQEIYTHAITIAQNTLPHPNTADVITEIRGMNKFRAQQFGISNEMLEQIKQNHAAGKTQTVVVYGSAYAVEMLKDYAECIIVAYEDDLIASQLVGEIISNKIQAEGVMPV